MKRGENMEYITIEGESSISFTEKRSEFIGHIAHVETAEEAIAFIEKIRSENRKATHNVYAYIIRDGHQSRYSDDGEPQGTAGVPVLNVLNKEDLTDVCCVVTRYFGGILLGGGGLVRAYSHSAAIVTESAKKVIMCRSKEITITADYDLYGKITSIIPEFEVKINNTEFGADVKISIYIKTEKIRKFKEKLIDATNGRIEFVESDEEYRNFA